MFLFLIAIIFSFSKIFGLISDQINLKETSEPIAISINQKSDLPTQTVPEQKNIFTFDGWSPKLPSGNKISPIVRKIEKILEDKLKSNDNAKEKNPNIIMDLTNNYKQEKDSLKKPMFDSESAMKQILELLKEKKKVILIAHSEGSFSLFETLIKIINSCKENKLIEEFPDLLKVYFIDPPLENFFTHVISLYSFISWLVGTTADWVQWISGISPDGKMKDRKFPFSVLTNFFLWSFRQFWKFFLVPITCSSMKSGLVFGEDAMFSRTLFVKSRAIENEKALSSVSKENAELMKKIITFYLQDWQKEKNRKIFESVGKIVDLPNNKNIDHLNIIKPALENIFSQF